MQPAAACLGLACDKSFLRLQILNVVFWIAPNSYVVTVPCRWNGYNSNAVNVFGVLRWSCW